MSIASGNALVASGVRRDSRYAFGRLAFVQRMPTPPMSDLLRVAGRVFVTVVAALIGCYPNQVTTARRSACQSNVGR